MLSQPIDELRAALDAIPADEPRNYLRQSLQLLLPLLEDPLNTASILDTRALTPRGWLLWREMDTDRFPVLCGESSPRHASPSIFYGESWRDAT
jgi:hypothetical protein